jgi:hypothetical protein
MNNFKLGREYINDNSIRRYNINVGEINPNEINDTINRIRDMFRDRRRTEIRHEWYRRMINPNENNPNENDTI